MASYLPSSTNVTPRQKLLPPRVEIVGQSRLDTGEGVVNMEAVGLLVDENGSPILDAENKEQFRGTGKILSVSIPEVLPLEFNGISGAQVLEYIGALFDHLAAQAFPDAE